MACFLYIFTVSLILNAVSSTISTEILNLHDSNNNKVSSVAVSVSNQELLEVANSVLVAETWLRNNVLSFYPGKNITHIVVGHNLLCSQKSHDFTHHFLILPALKNIHYSLTRWGLQHHVKVSSSFTVDCLHHLNHSLLKPVLDFMKSTNSSYLINPFDEISPKFQSLVHTHMEIVKKIGSLSFDDDFYLVQNNHRHNTMRKLTVVEGPLPPLVGLGPITSPPSPTHSTPHPHHHHHNLPPCNPWGGPVGPVGPVSAPSPPSPPQVTAPGPVVGQEKLWCVAKPSVPAETLQEAMDYACGDGGAECNEIQPNGSCFFPDTIVAHASYAFNSYFQKARKDGGTCEFGGTAMIINADPSFLQCKFSVS